MPNIVREELWKHPGFPGMIVVTTNATIKKNNALVMGRGAALQARDRIVCIDQECGLAIHQASAFYGFLVVRQPTEDRVGFGIFQVKDHFRDQADLELIEAAVLALSEYAVSHPDVAIRMNYPGIGCGGLLPAKVAPLLARLPDQVTICHRGGV